MTFPDGTLALRDATFTVHPGEFVTVVGPSGCGKSTLLRIASGLVQQSGGTVAVDRESLGYVFQDATLLSRIPRPVEASQTSVVCIPHLGKSDRNQQKLTRLGCRTLRSGMPSATSESIGRRQPAE